MAKVLELVENNRAPVWHAAKLDCGHYALLSWKPLIVVEGDEVECPTCRADQKWLDN